MHESQSVLQAHIVQYNIHWLEKERNIKTIEHLLDQREKGSDLIILPEMFNTGFYTRPQEIAESISGPTVQWMEDISLRMKSSVCGSICLINKKGEYTNSFLLVSDGKIQHKYDKKHLFSFADESRYMTAGNTRKNFQCRPGWTARPFICYDVRFPVWLRNDNNYELLLGVSNFPDARVQAWENLCTARAIENQCYLIGVNGMGTDPNGVYYSGHSLCIAPNGEIILNTKNQPGLFHIEIDKESLYNTRSKYPFLNDRDSFTILGNESN